MTSVQKAAAVSGWLRAAFMSSSMEELWVALMLVASQHLA